MMCVNKKDIEKIKKNIASKYRITTNGIRYRIEERIKYRSWFRRKRIDIWNFIWWAEYPSLERAQHALDYITWTEISKCCEELPYKPIQEKFYEN